MIFACAPPSQNHCPVESDDFVVEALENVADAVDVFAAHLLQCANLEMTLEFSLRNAYISFSISTYLKQRLGVRSRRLMTSSFLQATDLHDA